MTEESKLLDDEIILSSTRSVKIYSRKAIWGFSVFFTTIFGGVLLMQNLKDIGKKKEANLVLLGSLIFTVTTIFIVNIPKTPNSMLPLICNMLGGLVLSDVIFKKFFPSPDNYGRKKIWKPLIISMIIMIPVILGLILPIVLKR